MVPNSYQDKFNFAEDIIVHLDELVDNDPDDYIKSRYVGILVFTGVTAYELALKDIIISFSKNKNVVLGNFIETKINNNTFRLRKDDIRGDYLKPFGLVYDNKFKNLSARYESVINTKLKASMFEAYNNMISWRNDFAHDGLPPPNATYEEARAAYFIGKYLIRCVDRALNTLTKYE